MANVQQDAENVEEGAHPQETNASIATKQVIGKCRDSIK